MRIALTVLTIALSSSGCGSVEYKDTNAAVNANPQCAINEKPGELVAPWCKREQSANWDLGGGEGEPVDFGGDKDD